MVPLVDTDPDLADSPWGDNEGTVGLTPNRLLGDLGTVFEGIDPLLRNHWHSNPRKIPEEVVRELPRTVMALGKLDILYKSQVKFANLLRTQGVELDCMEVAGLHQVKDMDQVTAAGCSVREYVTQKSIEFVKRAKCSAGQIPDAMLKLNREDTMKG